VDLQLAVEVDKTEFPELTPEKVAAAASAQIDASPQNRSRSRTRQSGSYFAAAAPAIVYIPAQVYSNPPSAVLVVLQVPDPLMPFIFPVPPVI
jgi:hypothetical protein